MSQTVLVNRYCTIENMQCAKTIPFNGSWTYFFAYPDSTKMESWSNKLVNELNNRGVRGTRWKDIVNVGTLFSKVCEEIHGNDFLLAEITTLNLNVLLEIGYALAVGRQPILLQNQNSALWKPKLLSSLEFCKYETRSEVHEFITRWQDRRRDSHDPNRQLTFLKNMGIYDDQETPETTYHLKPKVSTDWISRIEKTLNKSFFKLTSMDPSDSVSDEFYVQARQIQRSSLIVSSFVSKDQVDWKETNASVALLTGFSIGLGKHVLILQEEPVAPILDLGTASRPFETEDQAQEIVDSWIKRHADLANKQTIELQQKASSKQQADLIRSIYMGHPDAQQDLELNSYFVPTKEFHDAIDGKRSIFVGRRGSGKSANFKAINEELSRKHNIVNVEILPDDYQLKRITNFLKDTTHPPDSRFTFQNIWNYVLTTEMLKTLAEKTDLLYYSSGDLSRNNLHDIYDTNFGDFELDFASRTVSALKAAMPTKNESPFDKVNLIAEEALKSLRDYDLNRQLKKFAQDKKITFFIVADDLDKHWDTNTMQAIDLLLGLISELARMQKFFGQYLKIALFLREDIFNTIAEHDNDLPKRDFLRMEWTKSNLHHLVALRLAKKVGDLTDEEVWSAIFREPVNNTKASDYILTRALPRPRDVLNFCQKAIDNAQINENSFVTKQDILDGEESFSETLFFSVSSEFRVQYPNLEEILIEFAGFEDKTVWNNFEESANLIIQNKREILKKWHGGRMITPYFLTEALFNVGLIGLSREHDSTVHFYSGKSFSRIWGLTSSNPTIHIHPAFYHSLDISTAPTTPQTSEIS